VFFTISCWNIRAARIFPLDGARRGYISLSSLLDDRSGGLPALPVLKIAAT
tara:strand:+ start:422 stop:574 length:153 start_codon:yes stop_codon:yes gene_type:complete